MLSKESLANVLVSMFESSELLWTRESRGAGLPLTAGRYGLGCLGGDAAFPAASALMLPPSGFGGRFFRAGGGCGGSLRDVGGDFGGLLRLAASKARRSETWARLGAAVSGPLLLRMRPLSVSGVPSAFESERLTTAPSGVANLRAAAKAAFSGALRGIGRMGLGDLMTGAGLLETIGRSPRSCVARRGSPSPSKSPIREAVGAMEV